MNFPTTKEVRIRKRNPKKEKWKSKIIFHLVCLFVVRDFVIEIAYFRNIFLFLFLVFFRSDVSSMFASAEEVQHFYYIILFTLCMLASPLRVVTIKFPKIFTAITKQKISFLLSNALMHMRKKSFCFCNKCCFQLKNILASATIVSRSKVITT